MDIIKAPGIYPEVFIFCCYDFTIYPNKSDISFKSNPNPDKISLSKSDIEFSVGVGAGSLPEVGIGSGAGAEAGAGTAAGVRASFCASTGSFAGSASLRLLSGFLT